MLALLLFTACIEIASAVVVYRADPRRWDNRLFATMGMVDAATSAVRALYVLAGVSIAEWAVGRVCAVLSIVLAYLTFEFTHSFPFSRPAPAWLRVPVAAMSLTAAGLFISPLAQDFARIATPTYFLPLLVVNVIQLVRNLRRVEARDAGPTRLVMAAILLRWCFAMAAYGVAVRISGRAFAVAITVEATAGVLIGSLLIGYAVLAGQLFRVRGAVAELVVHTSLALTGIATVIIAIEGALAWAPGPTSLRLLLLACTLLPLALVFAIRRLRGRIETALIVPLDPRRARRAAIVERVLSAGARADVCAALAEVSGGEVSLVRELPPELAARLAAESHVVGEGELHVAVRTPAELLGAIHLQGGQLDRDTLIAAEALAGHLAVMLENRALFTELEESRRLATLGAFAAAIAHDIRTPLASVQMNVQILRGLVSLPDDMEHFDIAQEELTRLNAHISELLDYAKPVRLVAESLELREVADDAARGIAAVLAERDIALRVEVPDGLPTVLGDAGRLRQILLNLLDNAVKASPPGGAVTLRGAQDGNHVSVEVADGGKGIPSADLERIFEPFYTTRPDGTGLGLAIVRKLVRAHQGEVKVRSAPGQGATFTVLLPTG